MGSNDHPINTIQYNTVQAITGDARLQHPVSTWSRETDESRDGPHREWKRVPTEADCPTSTVESIYQVQMAPATCFLLLIAVHPLLLCDFSLCVLLSQDH